jgi:hypothetical protein
MAEIERLDSIRFDSLLGGKNASAVCLLPDRALVVADEMTTIYVLGSHSARRKRVDEKNKYAKNRNALLAAAEPQPSHDVLVRARDNRR